MENFVGGLIAFIAIVVIITICSGVRIVNQYERGIVLRLGKYSKTKEPGLRLIIPYLDKLIKVDVRTTPMDIPKQEVITRDNVTVNVDAVVYFKVLNAEKAVLETTNYTYATSTFAQTALRDVTGNFDLDEILSKRDEISEKIREIVDVQTDKWGIDIENVKLQNIELPADMKRAMAKQVKWLIDSNEIKNLKGAIVLRVPRGELWRRLVARKRVDDTRAAIERRQDAYERNITGMIKTLTRNGVLVREVDGGNSPEDVLERIEEVLGDWGMVPKKQYERISEKIQQKNQLY